MSPAHYLRQTLGSIFSRRRKVVLRRYTLESRHLDRSVTVDVYRPAVPPWRLLSLCIFNDGQDLKRMQLKKRLCKLYRKRKLPPVLIIGVHADDRMREYGTAGRTDHEGRGDRAAAYEQFVTAELVPWLEERHNIYRTPARRAVAGFSLGGLSAFDLAYRNPNHFRSAGIFSGSLWYRSQPFDEARPDANRIVHDYVKKGKRPRARFWFMAGTDDETADRNGNGVIDSIDDTLQLMTILEQKGHQPEIDITYVEVEDGKHEPATWAEVIGEFLLWTFK